jgi:hypothetical protein
MSGYGYGHEALWYEAEPYEWTRSALAERYRSAPAETIERIVQQHAGISAEQFESFFSSLGSMAASLAPTILPIAGAAIGTVVGGPAGTAIGGALGQMAGSAVSAATAPRPAAAPAAAPQQQYAAPPAAPTPRAQPRVDAEPQPRPQPQPRRQPQTQPDRPARSGGGNAAGQLLSVLLRPEFIRALAASVLGSVGAESVPVGPENVPVPIGAFLNAHHVLSEQALTANHLARAGAGEAVPSYLVSESGEFKCEVNEPAERARVLLEMLHESPTEPAEEPYEWIWLPMEAADPYELAMAEYED